MALIDELKAQREKRLGNWDARQAQVSEHQAALREIEAYIADLDHAIAVLEPVACAEDVETQMTEEEHAALGQVVRATILAEWSEPAVVTWTKDETPETWETMERAEQGEVETVLLSQDDVKPEPVYGAQDDGQPPEMAAIVTDEANEPCGLAPEMAWPGTVAVAPPGEPQAIGFFISEGRSLEMRSDGSVVPLDAVSPLPSQIDQPTTNPDADEAARALAYYSPEEQRARAAPWPSLGNLFGSKPKVDV